MVRYNECVPKKVIQLSKHKTGKKTSVLEKMTQKAVAEAKRVAKQESLITRKLLLKKQKKYFKA